MEAQSITSENKSVNSKQTPSARESLEILYSVLGGENWIRQTNWCRNDAISEWSGVTCNSKGQVTVLELSQNNVTGTLEDERVLKALPSTLEQLWLSENKLTGNLPAAFGDRTRFPALTILDVGSNQLRGSLHPILAELSSQFSWFDITGNQLTSYFRHSSSSSSAAATTTSTLTTSSSSNPIPHVHVVESLLPPTDCQTILQLAIQHTDQNGGWQTDRHKDYKTTDIDVAIVGGDLLQHCNKLLENILLPALSQLFAVPLQDLAVEDLFVAKYSLEAQTSLAKHRDGSELSFVITLNDAFQGGGTQFVHDDLTIAPRIPGTAVLFCGRLWHAGVPITQGTRYILAGFVRVYPSTLKGKERLQEILDSCQRNVTEDTK